MRIKPEQLVRSLQRDARPLAWIFGDEPLLVQECADQVREHCRKSGFQDREVFSVERGFDWGGFSLAAANLSLFSERKLIELRLGDAGLDEGGREALLGYLAAPNPDYLLLLTGTQLDKSTLASKWFRNFEDSGYTVQVWPIGVGELPGWLGQRLATAGMRLAPDAMQLLVDRIEGNLLAAVQEIEKLGLLVNPGRQGTKEVSIEEVLEAVADSARFHPFILIDAALAGDGPRCLRIIHGLRDEGTEILSIVGAAGAELRRLLPMLREVEAGRSANEVVESRRLNFKRKAAVGRALLRMRPVHVNNLLDQARLVDFTVKGIRPGDPWLELEKLFLRMAGLNVSTLAPA